MALLLWLGFTTAAPALATETPTATSSATATPEATAEASTESTTESTATDAPAAFTTQPATEAPAPATAAEPTAEEPTAEEPTAEEPTAEEPTAEESAPDAAESATRSANAVEAPADGAATVTGLLVDSITGKALEGLTVVANEYNECPAGLPCTGDISGNIAVSDATGRYTITGETACKHKMYGNNDSLGYVVFYGPSLDLVVNTVNDVDPGSTDRG